MAVTGLPGRGFRIFGGLKALRTLKTQRLKEWLCPSVLTSTRSSHGCICFFSMQLGPGRSQFLLPHVWPGTVLTSSSRTKKLYGTDTSEMAVIGYACATLLLELCHAAAAAQPTQSCMDLDMAPIGNDRLFPWRNRPAFKTKTRRGGSHDAEECLLPPSLRALYEKLGTWELPTFAVRDALALRSAAPLQVSAPKG